MKLFYISADNSDGENLNLFVWATRSEEAIALWEAHFEIDESTERYGDLFEVPTTVPSSSKALDWDTDIVPGQSVTLMVKP